MIGKSSTTTAFDEFTNEWLVGDYWTFHLKTDTDTIQWVVSYYVVTRVELLGAAMYALAEVVAYPDGKEKISPLLLSLAWQQPRPAGWPFPVERVPKELAAVVLFPRDWLPKQGAWQRIETSSPGEEGPFFLVQGGDPTEVTVPAGTFPAVTLVYQGRQGSVFDEGQAWWSSQVKWWVRIEGVSQVQGQPPFDQEIHQWFTRHQVPAPQPTRYLLELIKCGRLERDELRVRLLQALKSTEECMPDDVVITKLIRSQLQEVGIVAD